MRSTALATEQALEDDYDLVLKGRLKSIRLNAGGTVLSIHVPNQSVEDPFGSVVVIKTFIEPDGRKVNQVGNQTHIYPVKLSNSNIQINLPGMDYCPLKPSSEIEICVRKDGTISQILSYEGHFRPLDRNIDPGSDPIRNRPLPYIERILDDNQTYPSISSAKPFEATTLSSPADMIVLRDGRFYLWGFDKGPGSSTAGWLVKKK